MDVYGGAIAHSEHIYIPESLILWVALLPKWGKALWQMSIIWARATHLQNYLWTVIYP